MSSVTLDSISKTYGSQTIIPPLSLNIKTGEFLSLLGPSGCGKTTLIRMIAGLETPTEGKVIIGEETVFDSSSQLFVPPERRNLGMVFQSYALWPHLTVFENIAFPLRCRKVPTAEIELQVETALEQVQLAGMGKRKPNELSGGQQQRVALARALVARPKVLLLDEPLSNLDTNLREEMCEQIAKLKGQFPMTMIYVTHDQNEAVRLSDRIAILNKGKIEQLGTVQEMRTSPKTEFV
ncbi:MAG: ABC transporter ATP-binding protein, partial [Proteobacteria bacterium]|nr:ABC transporter ATP-binding protein [Pseudomonadota bacterium]